MADVSSAVAALRPPDEAARTYLDFHRRRYEYLLLCMRQTLEKYPPRTGRPARLLDIGMSHHTRLIRDLFPDAELLTLGFFDFRFRDEVAGLEHIPFDLNDAAQEKNWPQVESFDLIVMAEVIEHLYASPVRVLSMLRSMLRPGGTLILQTPNPVSLARRLSLLRGISPFEVIRDDPGNPGHFCEYTVDQLIHVSGLAGLAVLDYSVLNYLGRPGWKNQLYSLACAVLPLRGHLEEGITMVLRRPG